ncbi:MAG: fluoride efflux transporter CrcB [Flavobacteriales bacterium]|jgi:CrcB protein|nr:fluoride efflux transporter CrcB [Flavobacteriales bacterium]
MGMMLAIFIGGGLGSVSRYGVSKLVTLFWNGDFPMGTFIANLLSCVVMGLIVGVFHHKITSPELRGLILIGFCGGFSTFSTFSKETLDLMQNGDYVFALLNVIISLVSCLFVLWLFTHRSI